MASAFSVLAGVVAVAIINAARCAAAAGSCGETDDPGLLQARATLQRAGQGNFTFTSPDPQLLIWDPGHLELGGYSFLRGWLNVPLFYDEIIYEFEAAPHVCLRVWGLPAREQPARSGPLLGHNGGPGSSVDGVFRPLSFGEPLGDVRGSYDLLGISQRGIDVESSAAFEPGTDDASECPFKQKDGKPVPVYPILACNEIARKSHELCKVSSGTMSVLEIASCPAFNSWAAEVLPGFTANMNMDELFYNTTLDPLWWANASKVQWWYRFNQLNHNLCYVAPRFQMTAPSGRTYNTFNYVGTTHLAHDIDLLREAVGSDKMSITGSSYGTAVGAVYATVFPDRTYRLLVDGLEAPLRDVRSLADFSAESTWAVWNGLAQACDASLQQSLPPSQVCPLAPNSTRQLQELISRGGDVGVEAYSIANDMVYADVSPALGMHQLWMLANGQPVGGDIDDTGRYDEPLEDPEFRVDIMDDTQQAAVLGLDIAGRLTEADFLSLWARLMDQFPPVGVDRGLGYAAMVGTWAAMPKPVPPMFSLPTRALIVGNLWDAQTGYANAQLMKQNFPSGSLMTWQGYGHTMQEAENVKEVLESARAKSRDPHCSIVNFTNAESKTLCMMRAAMYLDNGTLPPDGYICPAPWISLGPAAAKEAEAATIMELQAGAQIKARGKRAGKRARKRFRRRRSDFGRGH